MKLYYTTGCISTSLMVDGTETIDLKKEEMKEVVKKMISYIWGLKHESTYDIVRSLVQDTGDFYSFMYGENPCTNEITVSRYNHNENTYLAVIDLPVGEDYLLVNELICDYSKLTRQEKWDPIKHCTKEYKDIVFGMIDKVEDFAILQEVFCRIMERVGREEEPYYCECCCDTVYSYSLEI